MFKTFLISLSLIVAVFILEITLIMIKPTIYEKDSILGWKIKKNFQHDFLNFTKNQKRFSSNFTTNKDGYLEYKVNGNFKKTLNFLIIGDSFSTDPLVSNDKFWYSIMAEKISERNKLNVNTIITGGGGYGTLQQLLISNEFKVSKPDVFILQFCINDFENNILEWEKRNYRFSQYFWRPYLNLKNKEIYYEENIIKSIFKPFKESRIFNVLLSRSGILAEKYLSNNNEDNEDNEIIYQNSLKVTYYLLNEIYKNFPLSNKILLSCKKASKFPDTEWKTIGRKIGYKVLSQNNIAIEKAIKNNLDIFNIDAGHYNELGNKIFGEAIAEEIEKRKLLRFTDF